MEGGSWLTLKGAILKNCSGQKFWNQIHLGLNYSPTVTLPILSSLRQKEDLTPTLAVRINRCNGHHIVGTVPGRVVHGQQSPLLLVFLLLQLLELFKPSRGGRMIVLVGDRENTTKNILLHFMILVIAVGREFME